MGFIRYIDLDWPDLFRAILTSKTNFFNRIRIRREVIPIIFIPGTMGSRLKNSKTNKIVWDPDDNIFMLRKYGLRRNTPAMRKELLIGKQFSSEWLQVTEDNSPRRDYRGWGGVYWDCYGGLLEELYYYNWNKPVCSDDKDKKKEMVGKCFEFPVHAFGYNWTDSNLNSGRLLADEIDKIIKKYKEKGRLCKYAILVTHSMGGLVARSACMLHGASKQVLGVIHGVQPAVGAAAAYWRMKAGFERRSRGDAPLAWVLGTNGEEVTCILGNAPGGLELLPTKDYTANDGSKQWLHVTLKSGKKISLPKYDPYEEIYRIGKHRNMVTNKSDASFWRLVNPEWLDPIDKKNGESNAYAELEDPWDSYLWCISKAKKFHDDLKTSRHQSTYQFYSSGLSTVDKISFGHDEFFFRKQRVLGAEIIEPSQKVSSRGECTLYTDIYNQEIRRPLPHPQKTFIACMSKISDYREGGDGTVPDSSGGALRGEGLLKTSKMKEYDHQSVYKKHEARNFVITVVRNLALRRIDEGIKEEGVGNAK